MCLPNVWQEYGNKKNFSKCEFNKWIAMFHKKCSLMYSFAIFLPMIKVNEGFIWNYMEHEVLYKCVCSVLNDVLLKEGSLIT